jgi:pRiA4b ORF-3-like protein
MVPATNQGVGSSNLSGRALKSRFASIAIDVLPERSENVARYATALFEHVFERNPAGASVDRRRSAERFLMPKANQSKQVRKPASVVLRIELYDIEPLIWRRIVVPTSWPMSTLHNYLQWAMGWQDTHPHEFRVLDKVIAPA